MRLRYAPSPSGLMHVGQARVALANALLARRHGGAFMLRVEDTDAQRSRADYAEAIAYDLHWLGITWDERQDQSARLDLYAQAAERLKAAGRLYPCFESEEELAAKRELRVRRKQPPLYDRAMLKLTPEQRASAEANGKRPHWRFLLSGYPAEWTDLVLGPQSVKLSAVSDPVVIRADGTPLYPFTTVVDDVAASIGHIVRDADQVTNTGIQIDMMAALGARPAHVRFGHLPPLEAPAGNGKRQALPTVRSLRGDGIEPAALVGYLARLGTPDAPAPQTVDEIAPTYDVSRVTQAARFDGRALLALNRRVLHDLPFDVVRDRLPPLATGAFWAAVRGNLDLLNEARGWWDVVAGTIVPPLIENEAEYLHTALETLPAEPWGDDIWTSWTEALRLATGRRGKALWLPLRLALTGEDHGPELRDLLPLMGRARTADRLRLAAA